MDLLDAPCDELFPDGSGVHLGQEVLDRIVGRGRDPFEDRVGIVVAGLDALEVQHREATQPGQLAREARIDHRVHRRGDDRDRERDPGQRTGDVDVGRLDRLGAGSQRDVLEAERGAEVVDLRAKRAARRERGRRGAGRGRGRHRPRV
jgi:hypothetical protein